MWIMFKILRIQYFNRSLMAKGKGKKEQGQQQAQGGEQKKK
ncbi:hypothetical protein [Metallosphaera yellowstonensis]|jgi:hypothetical protein|nr:hypothetical protein [Metallosphaera yellowstonensis]